MSLRFLLSSLALLSLPVAAQSTAEAPAAVDSIRVVHPLYCGRLTFEVLTMHRSGTIERLVRGEGPDRGLWRAILPALNLDSAAVSLTGRPAPDRGLGWICTCDSPKCDSRGITIWRGLIAAPLPRPESPQAAAVIDAWLDSLRGRVTWQRLTPLGASSVPAN